MRLVFLYAREPVITFGHYSAEGLHLLFIKLIQENVVDEVVVIAESLSKQSYAIKVNDRYSFNVIPRPPQSTDLLPGDVVWVRGAFKAWLPLLHELHEKQTHWMLFYGANTGRERWPFWHVVFNDLTDKVSFTNRLELPYVKPINTDIFKPADYPILTGLYDVCLGASNIHDKKGQWRAVKLLGNYKALYEKELFAFVPGALRKGTWTNKIPETIAKCELKQVHFTGELSRSMLAFKLGCTRVFVHMGLGGQGDRGPLEALSCGCRVFLAGKKRHSPIITSTSKYCQVAEEPDNYVYTAIQLNKFLSEYASAADVSAWFHRVHGIDRTISMFSKLMPILKECPLPNLRCLGGYYV